MSDEDYQAQKSVSRDKYTKTNAAQNEVALSYHRVRGLYLPVIVFVPTIVYTGLGLGLVFTLGLSSRT